jgi:hypothetical protein
MAKDLTMRLSDAGLRRHQTKLLYPDHRLPPWLTEDATARSLEPIVRLASCETRRDLPEMMLPLDNRVGSVRS